MAYNNSSVVEFPDFDDEQSAAITLPDINHFFAVFLPLLSVSTIIGNAAVILAFLKVPGLQEKPSDLLILNLSVNDFALGWIMLIFMTPSFIEGFYWRYGEIGCKMWASLGNIFGYGSLSTLCAVSYDRVLLVTKEYPRYVKLQSRNRIKITICLCWITPLISMALEIGLWEKAKEINLIASLINFDYSCLSPPRRIHAFSLFNFLFFILVPVLVVTCLSGVFLYFLHQRLKKNKRVAVGSTHATQTTSGNCENLTMVVVAAATASSVGNSSASNANNNSELDKSRSAKNRYIKPAVTLAVLVIAMTICMVPYCFYVIIGALCPHCIADINHKVRFTLILLQYCNSLLDPFLYAMTQSKIKRYYKIKLQSFLNRCRP